MNINSRTRIFVAGSDTLLGRALCVRLGVPPDEPDLTDAFAVDDFFAATRPEVVFMAAGLLGGIHANQKIPADLTLNNLLVSAHVLSAAARHGVQKLLYLGSSCMYPRLAYQPLRPDMLQCGPLEPTNVAYATAKLAGVRLCQAYREQNDLSFIAGIPANSFGPHDDFGPGTGHVISALMGRMHEAKRRADPVFTIWGTGTPKREFIFAPDLADACVFVLDHYDDAEPINLGSGMVYSIAEVARLIAEVVGYQGELRFDPKKPDGMPRKFLDSSKLFALGWRPATEFRAALEETYEWYLTSNGELHGENISSCSLEPTVRNV
jgi:GDP-L-fucose synthase